jgi:hypothetical protein
VKRHRALALGGLALATLLLAAPPAHAKLGPGAVAPEFEGADWFNTDPTSLKDQRGRLVFLELFSTG